MFLETKRDGEAITKPDIWTFPPLIAWLETMPAHLAYRYTAGDDCVICQYLREKGWTDPSVGVNGVFGMVTEQEAVLPPGWDDIAFYTPHTFGGALKRAREWAARATK